MSMIEKFGGSRFFQRSFSALYSSPVDGVSLLLVMTLIRRLQEVRGIFEDSLEINCVTHSTVSELFKLSFQ